MLPTWKSSRRVAPAGRSAVVFRFGSDIECPHSLGVNYLAVYTREELEESDAGPDDPSGDANRVEPDVCVDRDFGRHRVRRPSSLAAVGMTAAAEKPVATNQVRNTLN